MRRGFGLVYTGKLGEALEDFKRSERLSPLDPFAVNIHVGIGPIHFAAGRFDEVMQYAQMVLDERPGLAVP